MFTHKDFTVSLNMIFYYYSVMKNKTILYFLIILNSLLLFSCSQESDIALLEKRIDELVDAIEHHQKNKISNYLAKDFLTAKNANKAQFLLFVRYQLKRNKNISVVLVDKNIIYNKNSFDVTFRVLLLGSNRLLPERGQLYKVNSRWTKESGEWLINRLRWERAKLNE